MSIGPYAAVASSCACSMLENLASVWHWLTTTRYTRLLEEELARLRIENVALRNSIYARAGVPPVEYADAVVGAARGNGRPAAIRRAMSWAQAKARLEAMHRRPAHSVNAEDKNMPQP
jgi:hypothetical protein